MKKYDRLALIILDGFGLSSSIKGNAIINANPEFINSIFQNYPFTTLTAHGKDVGLPRNTMGNSEVGHSNIGAGRIIMQDLTKIDMQIENDTLKNNKTLSLFLEKIKTGNSRVHLIGLLSESGVHSELSHLLYLIRFFRASDVKEIYIHTFLDGRDSPPTSGKVFLKELIEEIIKLHSSVFLSTMCGRFYAMDRDTRWDRTKTAFDLLTGLKGEEAGDPILAIKRFYDNGITDEFMPPIVIDNKENKDGSIKQEDSVLFFNFRADRAKQLTMALTFKYFDNFSRDEFKPVKNFISMTKYDGSFENDYIIPPENYINTLGQVIENNGFNQFRIAETEKYAHVTYFFNCGKEEPFKHEDRLLIPSPREYKTYDMIPEMSAFKVKDALIERIKSNKYKLIVCNFANCDMVGHTGDYNAAVKAVKSVNLALSEIIPVILNQNHACIITADHGNAETMLDENDMPMTNHTLNPVPFAIVSNYPEEIPALKPGKLADIAPTILKLLGIEIPGEMTGRILWE